VKALICSDVGALSALTVRDLPSPIPGPRQLLIDIKAASINFPDVLMVQGKYQFKPPLPFSPGSELAGIVTACGVEVTNYSVGDAVVAIVLYGAMAEECVVDSESALPIPQGMDFATAASFFVTYGTSYHALVDRAQICAGETLLALGAAGGVGIAAIEIGKALGATVIAAASSAEKLALCRAHGADQLINYATEDLRERLNSLLGKAGVDVVYDPVGSSYSETALRALRFGGRFLVVGFAAGEIAKIPLNLALLNERSILGVFWGEWIRRDPARYHAGLRQLGDWFRAGQLKPAITERVSLSGAIDALQRMANRQVSGKVIVLPES
jgi:NADPH2:quinone reductase